MTHENVNSFIGLNVEPPKGYILWMYCSRGSLQDILENDDIALDTLFKRSLIKDLTAGKKKIQVKLTYKFSTIFIIQ